MVCPDCGARHEEGGSCGQDFYTLLGWENEYAGLGVVHHLLVLCYHLQHPRLYSPEGLNYSKRLLVDFLEKGKTTGQVRRENRSRVSSTNRKWNLKGKAGAQGAYARPMAWRMTAADVVHEGPEGYVENVRAWADSVLRSLREAGEV